VLIVDAFGNTVTTATNSVTVSIANDPAGGSTLSGTTTRTASSGVANFSGLKIDQVGNGFTLQANSVGLPTPTVISNPFDITP
jgi:hypothetical protein